MRTIVAFAVGVAIGCHADDSGPTAEEVLANIIAEPHDCSLDEHVPDEWGLHGDCYVRRLWGSRCEEVTPALETTSLVASYPTYSPPSGVFTITDEATMRAHVEAVAWQESPVMPPIDFSTHIAAGHDTSITPCNFQEVDAGLTIDDPPRIYRRVRRLAPGCEDVVCDYSPSSFVVYAIPRERGFPSFCIDTTYTACE